jgi:hypothetical protein
MRAPLAITAALVFVAPHVAIAQSSASPATASSPRDLLRRGFELRGAGRDAEALAVFRQAYSIAAEPTTLAQIALAEHALGRWVEAERDLRQALDAAPTDRWIRSHAAPLREALVEIERHIGTLELSDGVSGAHVLIDGVEVGTLPLAQPLRVRLGPLDVRIEAEGYETWHRTLDATSSLTREPVIMQPIVVTSSAPISSEPPSASPPPAPVPTTLSLQPARPPPASSRIGAGPVVIAAGGAAFLAVGMVFYGLRLGEQSDLTTRCAPYDNAQTAAIECPRDLGPEAVYSRMELFNGLSIAGVALGSALVATGVAWAIVRVVAQPSFAATGSVTFTPHVDREGAGAMIEVRF